MQFEMKLIMVLYCGQDGIRAIRSNRQDIMTAWRQTVFKLAYSLTSIITLPYSSLYNKKKTSNLGHVG